MSQTLTSALAGLALAIAAITPAHAQSLEEVALTFERAGFASKVRQEGAGVVVAEDINLEARVIDPAACVVRITNRNRPAETSIGSDWGSSLVTPSPNLDAIYKELYFGRVIPGDIKRVPQVLSTRGGVVVEQMSDAKWRLPGSPGDEVWCQFWPGGRKTCWDHIEVERLSMVRGLPDQDQRTARTDRALVHLYADLCKGASKRVPF